MAQSNDEITVCSERLPCGHPCPLEQPCRDKYFSDKYCTSCHDWSGKKPMFYPTITMEQIMGKVVQVDSDLLGRNLSPYVQQGFKDYESEKASSSSAAKRK